MIIDLSKLLHYFERLNEAMDLIYPDKITWKNIEEFNYDLNIKHPYWVQAHFPLIMIYHREKAGKLRDSKNLSIMYQNNQNILTQLVVRADDFGQYHRKNKHKGFSNIVAAISTNGDEMISVYSDKQKPIKYKNFLEFSNVYAPGITNIKALCEILEENYTCDSTGQLRLI